MKNTYKFNDEMPFKKMDSNIIQKYTNKTIPQLIKLADKYFHAWIRKRDAGLPCISCGAYNTSDASHFYSAGHYPALRFNSDNVHLACKRCNLFLSGNLIEYRKNLIKKIGIERVEKLDFLVAVSKRNSFKWERFSLIEKIIYYSNELKK